MNKFIIAALIFLSFNIYSQTKYGNTYDGLVKMANNGDGNAANQLGNFYKRGFQQPNSNFSPIPIDLNEARRWFELAIKNNSVFGYFNMGVFYEEGLGGVNKDLNKAIEFYKIAAQTGHSQSIKKLEALGSTINQEIYAADTKLVGSASGQKVMESNHSIRKSNLPACQGDIPAKWDSCFGTNTSPSGSIFVGEYKEGKPNGQGTLNFTNGDKYVGEWRNGRRNGQGTYNWISGNKYVGDFKDDKRNGQGTLTFPSGAKYFGEFIDGKYNGRGILTFADGRRQEGIWSDGSFVRAEPVQQGTTANAIIPPPIYEQIQLSTCQGSYQANWSNCIGSTTYSNGVKYVGEYKEGQINGQGEEINRDGEKYAGEFRYGKRHGLGTLYSPNGSIINQGIYVDGKFVRGASVQQATTPNSSSQPLNSLDNERKRLEDERRQLAEDRRKLEEEKQKTLAQPSIASSPVISTSKGKRIALVIGNASYSSVPVLVNSTNDARAVAKALQESGFEVMKYENADHRQMLDVVRLFGEKLGKNDVGLFYFAGHGVQVKGKNYLIPVKENIKKSFEVPSGSLDADLVLATMENAKNSLNIMILDACRSPFPSEGRSLNSGLASLDAAKGTLIAYATAPGKEAQDGQGGNSPYTKNLVKALQQKGLSIEQVFKQVRIAVVEETKGLQVPWENSSIMGDFYFKR